MEKQSFDLEDIYDAEIAPLMQKIIELCRAHQLPMFATFLYKNDVENGDPCCCTSFLSAFDKRPIPKSFLDLGKFYQSTEALRLRVRNKDGIVTEEIAILQDYSLDKSESTEQCGRRHRSGGAN